MNSKFKSQPNRFYDISMSDFSLEAMDETLFIEAVKKKFPLHNSATFSIQEISLLDIVPLTKFVITNRLSKASTIINKFICAEIEPFRPVFFNYKNQLSQFVAPPVIECHGNKMVLCDGTHRVFQAKHFGIEKIFCLVIENVKKNLPGSINQWKNMQISAVKIPSRDNFIDFKPDLLSGYTYIFNSEKVWQNCALKNGPNYDVFLDSF